MAYFKEAFSGSKGYEELRKYIKQGGDFSKEVSLILQERSELESTYAKGMLKLSHKLAKSSKELVGSAAMAWQEVSVAMGHEAELHKNLAQGIQEDITKQLKILVESQHKTRKTIEASVEKTIKVLNDRRADEQKCKRQSHAFAKESEKLQEIIAEAKSNPRSKPTEKELAKVDQKLKKAEDSLQKWEGDYYTACLRAERARQSWELSVLRASEQFQLLEEDRLVKLQDLVEKYCNHLNVIGQDCSQLTEAVAIMDPTNDIFYVIQTKGTGPNVPEQYLPDFYAEDLTNNMRKERRFPLLQKYLRMVQQTLEMERKGQEGLRTLNRAVSSSSNFSDASNTQKMTTELENMEAMHNYLEAFQYKLECAMADLEGRQRPTYALSSHLQNIRDKQGTSQMVLKVPPWSKGENQNGNRESFSSHVNISSDSNSTHQTLVSRNGCQAIGHCRALYVYEGHGGEELTIRPGDILTLYSKSDEWWHGELNGATGYFPATYVEELPS